MALKVGDSIIDRIADAVVAASSVIAIVSSNSVASEWVRKELSLAMTSEIKGRSVKVLPAVIDECAVPASISDKLFADFRRYYFWGLSKLLEALDPRDRDSRWESRFRRLDDTQQLEEQFERILEVWPPRRGEGLGALKSAGAAATFRAPVGLI